MHAVDDMRLEEYAVHIGDLKPVTYDGSEVRIEMISDGLSPGLSRNDPNDADCHDHDDSKSGLHIVFPQGKTADGERQGR
ncbi:MAG TPA: hypothetical protein PKC18_16860 [Lacipirellulaceae bacterium]|nr:hypothetical protein [Lacipirellulaceae bacterium]